MGNCPNQRRINGSPCRSFFVCQTEAAQEPPDRNAVDRDAVAIRQFHHQIVQGQVGLLDQPPLDAVRYDLAFSMTATVALRARVKRPCFALQDDHVVDELYRNPEPGRSRTMRMPFFYEPNYPQPKRHRMWSTHLDPPYLPSRQGIRNQDPWES